MEDIKNEHGGGRKNSGRKPISDKKITVPIYPAQSRIDKIGLDRVKDIALEAVEKEYKRLNKS